MRDGGLSIGAVAPLLESPDPPLRRTAAGIIASHPQWAGEAVALLAPWLVQDPLDGDRREFLRQVLNALIGDERIRGLIGDALARDEVPKPTKILLLEVVAASEADEPPPSWGLGLGHIACSFCRPAGRASQGEPLASA